MFLILSFLFMAASIVVGLATPTDSKANKRAFVAFLFSVPFVFGGVLYATATESDREAKDHFRVSQQTRTVLVGQMDKTGEWEEVYRDEMKTIMRQGQMTITVEATGDSERPAIDIRFLTQEKLPSAEVPVP